MSSGRERSAVERGRNDEPSIVRALGFYTKNTAASRINGGLNGRKKAGFLVREVTQHQHATLFYVVAAVATALFENTVCARRLSTVCCCTVAAMCVS